MCFKQITWDQAFFIYNVFTYFLGSGEERKIRWSKDREDIRANAWLTLCMKYSVHGVSCFLSCDQAWSLLQAPRNSLFPSLAKETPSLTWKRRCGYQKKCHLISERSSRKLVLSNVERFTYGFTLIFVPGGFFPLCWNWCYPSNTGKSKEYFVIKGCIENEHIFHSRVCFEGLV